MVKHTFHRMAKTSVCCGKQWFLVMILHFAIKQVPKKGGQTLCSLVSKRQKVPVGPIASARQMFCLLTYQLNLFRLTCVCHSVILRFFQPDSVTKCTIVLLFINKLLSKTLVSRVTPVYLTVTGVISFVYIHGTLL
jgi:hypothetical protein